MCLVPGKIVYELFCACRRQVNYWRSKLPSCTLLENTQIMAVDGTSRFFFFFLFLFKTGLLNTRSGSAHGKDSTVSRQTKKDRIEENVKIMVLKCVFRRRGP